MVMVSLIFDLIIILGVIFGIRYIVLQWKEFVKEFNEFNGNG